MMNETGRISSRSQRGGAHGLKKRRGLVECNLDDRFSSNQKTVEEVTGLFPQMSPKSVVAETLRILDIAGEVERRTQTMNGALRWQVKVGVNGKNCYAASSIRYR